MSHAALIALMNNQSFTSSVDEFVNFAIGFLEFVIYYTNILWTNISTKYMEIFGDKHYFALSSFLIIIYAGISIVERYDYFDQMKETADQIQYLKKKNVILQGNLEFLLDNISNNEIKITRLTKQVKKLQKEIDKYI
jgi:hypothetical protein